MRILQVIEFFSPSMGGSAQVVYQAARHLARRGHEVTVCASDYSADGSRFPDDSFETVLFPCPVARWGFYPSPGLVGWARRHVREFDVIHMHNVRTFQNVAVASVARRHGVPYVISAHGSLSHEVGRGRTKAAFDRVVGRSLIESARILIAVSPLEVDQYRAAGVAAGRIALIPNGLDLTEFDHLPPPGRFRAKHGILPNAPLLVSLGRIHAIKGLDLLVEAFPEVLAQAADAWLTIAGPDEGELARLRRAAALFGVSDRVIFPGPLYGDDKLSALVDADVVVTPSSYEVFGLVSFEALMCGTPAVVAEGSGAAQLLHEIEAVYHTPFGDATALALALTQVLADRSVANAKTAAGSAFVRRELEWGAIAARLEQIYIGKGAIRA